MLFEDVPAVIAKHPWIFHWTRSMTAAGNAINVEVKLQVPGLTERMLFTSCSFSTYNILGIVGSYWFIWTKIHVLRFDFLLQNSGETGSFAVWQIQGGLGDVVSRHSTFCASHIDWESARNGCTPQRGNGEKWKKAAESLQLAATAATIALHGCCMLRWIEPILRSKEGDGRPLWGVYVLGISDILWQHEHLESHKLGEVSEVKYMNFKYVFVKPMESVAFSCFLLFRDGCRFKAQFLATFAPSLVPRPTVKESETLSLKLRISDGFDGGEMRGNREMPGIATCASEAT